MTNETIPQLTLDLPDSAVPGFAALLQHGILCPVAGPVQIRPFLLALPGFTADYIEGTVQTIFINGSAADTLDRPLGCGGTLALSAAMPGLAGAIFRREGLHGSLRSRTASDECIGDDGSGHITLKLFNSIAADRVLDLLERGIRVSGQALAEFAGRRPDLFQPPTVLTLDGRPVDAAGLMAAAQQAAMIDLQARVRAVA